MPSAFRSPEGRLPQNGGAKIEALERNFPWQRPDEGCERVGIEMFRGQPEQFLTCRYGGEGWELT